MGLISLKDTILNVGLYHLYFFFLFVFFLIFSSYFHRNSKSSSSCVSFVPVFGSSMGFSRFVTSVNLLLVCPNCISFRALVICVNWLYSIIGLGLYPLDVASVRWGERDEFLKLFNCSLVGWLPLRELGREFDDVLRL